MDFPSAIIGITGKTAPVDRTDVVLRDDGQNIDFAHHDQFFTVDDHFGAGITREEAPISLADLEYNLLSIDKSAAISDA